MASKQTLTLTDYHRIHLEPRWRKAPFVLRITEWKDAPPPVLVLKERQASGHDERDRPPLSNADSASRNGRLAERGHLSGESLRRCLPIMRSIVSGVQDEVGVPLEIQRFLTQHGLRLCLNLPLDEESGAKLGLIFRLQERITDLDRVELIARRVERFSREEAAYWLSRITSFSPDARRWAIVGMRVMLGGQAKDAGVERALERLRV